MSINVFRKDPASNLDYSLDWSEWLAEDETIITSTWVASSEDITLADESNTDTLTTVWVSDGVAGVDYVLTNEITTSDDRVDARSITITCENR
jgi:hypothetical protein